jgi:hypothetical protein
MTSPPRTILAVSVAMLLVLLVGPREVESPRKIARRGVE